MVEFYLAVFLMLVSAWFLGEVAHRARQPALVGQLLGGVLIGPAVLNIVQPTADLTTVENIGLFFMMLLTGLTVKPHEIIAAGYRAAIISLIAFAIPFVGGTEVALALGVGMVSSLVIGLAISITAVPVNALILMELGLLDSRLGHTVIAAGVIDDVVSFVVLAGIEEFAAGGNPASAVAAYGGALLGVAKIAVFLGGALLCQEFFRRHSAGLRERTKRLGPQFRAPGSSLMALLTFAVGVSLLAEWAGLQLVIGAFFAGLLLGEFFGAEALGKASDVFHGATFGFFAPLAFGFIGLQLVLPSVAGLELLGATLVVAITSKFFGGYTGARLTGFSPTEGLTIGFLMNSRGFVELVVAATAYQLGLIDQTFFSMAICIGIVTTVISPMTSRAAMRRMKDGTRTAPRSPEAEATVTPPPALHG